MPSFVKHIEKHYKGGLIMKKDMKRFKDAYLEELNFGDDVRMV